MGLIRTFAYAKSDTEQVLFARLYLACPAVQVRFRPSQSSDPRSPCPLICRLFRAPSIKPLASPTRSRRIKVSPTRPSHRRSGPDCPRTSFLFFRSIAGRPPRTGDRQAPAPTGRPTLGPSPYNLTTSHRFAYSRGNTSASVRHPLSFVPVYVLPY